jgi:hypothetical protein
MYLTVGYNDVGQAPRWDDEPNRNDRLSSLGPAPRVTDSLLKTWIEKLQRAAM